MTVLEIVASDAAVAKRRHGEGGIRKRGNSYAIRYRVGGRQIQETIGPDREAAELALAEKIVEIRKGQLSAEQEAYTLRQTARDWLDSIKRDETIKPATKDGWRIAIESHLIPAMGSRPISRIDVADLIEYLDAKRDGQDSQGQILPVAGAAQPGRRLSPATLRQHRTALRMVWEYAVIRKRCAHNIVKDLPKRAKPRIDSAPVKTLERDEVRRLIASTSGQDQRIVQILVSLGIRLGEAFALRVSDYDPSSRLLHVQRTIRRGSGDTWTTEGDHGKTFSADRWLHISEDLAEIITEQIANNRQSDLIFSSQAGTILNPGNWRSRKWSPACAAAGVPDAKPNYLRHTFASHQIIVQGRTPYEVSQMMGHKDASITLRVYTHFFREQQARKRTEAVDTLSTYAPDISA